jgi:hypothetical protein
MFQPTNELSLRSKYNVNCISICIYLQTEAIINLEQMGYVFYENDPNLAMWWIRDQERQIHERQTTLPMKHVWGRESGTRDYQNDENTYEQS